MDYYEGCKTQECGISLREIDTDNPRGSKGLLDG